MRCIGPDTSLTNRLRSDARPKDSIAMGAITGEIQRHILSYLNSSSGRISTPTTVVASVLESFPSAKRKDVRAVIAAMVQSGQLIYSNRFSTSHLELNYFRSFPVSEHVYLEFENTPISKKQGTVAVRLVAGDAFGCGDHPTTRLCLAAVDSIMGKFGAGKQGVSVLDVGTGNGVLALAALKLGAAYAVGLDIDPVARYEAGLNASFNDVANRFSVVDMSPDVFPESSFDLVVANLRPPTLLGLVGQMVKAVKSHGGFMVLSGFRPQETTSIRKRILKAGGCLMESGELAGWGAFLVKFEI